MTQKDVCKLLDDGFEVLRRYYERENLRGKQRACVKYAFKNATINGTCIGYSWRVWETFDSDKDLDTYMEARLQNDKTIEYE